MPATPSYMPVYRRADIVMVRGEGVYLFDENGKSYLDCAGGVAVNALGHNHPKIVDALKTQADQLWHCSNNYLNQPLIDFSQKLVELSRLSSVFFCSSGVEAVEAGIKFIRKFWHEAGAPNRKRIITFEGGFHGRSMAALSAGSEGAFRAGYEPFLEGFDRTPFNDLEAVRALIGPDTAAIMIEPVQGEGGIRPASKAFLHGLRALCDEHDLLLFLDEVQCGYGRSGQLFTYDYYGVMPDLVSCAKAMGNGFPLGACVVADKIALAMTPGCHGSTYGSNPLAMAVGLAVLEVMQQPGFYEHVTRMGAAMMDALKALQSSFPHIIIDVRGVGLILGVELHIDARAFAAKLREAGLLVAPAQGNVLRFLPPLTIEQNHIDEMQRIMQSVCAGEGK